MKKQIFLFTAIFMAIGQALFAQTDYTLTNDDVKVSNGVITSCSYDFSQNANGTNLIIPDTLDGQSIIAIDDASDYKFAMFYNKSITAISLPLTIEKIGENAFHTNSISELDLSNYNALTDIAESAFESNSIKTLNLSGCSNLTTIQDYAFQSNVIDSINFTGCTALTKIGREAFSRCLATHIDFSPCTALTDIESNAFAYSSVENINFNGCISLETIAIHAFYECPIIAVDLSNCSSLISIEYGAFENDSVTSVNLSGCTSLTTIERNVFYNCPVDTVNFSGCSALEEIGGHAFYECPVTTLDFSDCSSLKTIGYRAFYYCKQLRTVNLQNCSLLEVIERDVFNSCDYLASVNMSGCSSLTLIGDYAFQKCNISKLRIDGCTSLQTIENNAFLENPIDSIDFADCKAIEYIGVNAFSGAKFSTVDFSNCSKLTTIGDRAFYNVPITTLDLRNCISLKTIGGYAFYKCQSDTVNLSGCKSLEMIDNYAFYGAPIKSVNLDNCTALKNIGAGAFYQSNLEILDLRHCVALNEIESMAFYNNIYLDSVYFNNCTSLGNIGQMAFAYGALRELDLSHCTSLHTISEGAFRNSNSLSTIKLSGCSSLSYIGTEAFYRNSNDTLLFDGCSSLSTIKEYAFSQNALNFVDLSACTALTSIGGSAFSDNSSLSGFDLPTHSTLSSLGWVDANTTAYSGGDNVTDLAQSYTIPEYGQSQFKITYFLDEGVHSSPNPSAYLNTVGITSFNNAERTGYNFGGWYTSQDFTNEITSIAANSTKDYILFAKFTAIEYNISYNLNGGDNSAENPTTHSAETNIILQNASRTYYTFDGWYAEAGFSTKVDAIFSDNTSDVELYAKWVLNNYDVVFDANSGVGDMVAQSIPYGNTETLAANSFTKLGHSFTGWNTAADGSGTAYANAADLTMAEEGITLYAQWSAKMYSLSYNENGGTGTMTGVFVTFGSTKTIATNTFTRTGYTFTEWNTKFNGSGDSYNNGTTIAMNEEGITLYAQWEANNYDITYDANSGTGTMATQGIDFETSETLDVNSFTKLGHSFTGWNTSVDGSGTSYNDKANFTMNEEGITLYAQWEKANFNIVFDANGGTGTMDNQTITFDATETITTNTFIRKGYTFAGWNTAANSSGTAYADSADITMDVEGITLYAQWTANNYDLVFNANNGEGTMNNQTIAFDATAALLTNNFTRTGYAFAGWNTTSDGSGTTYANEADFRMNKEGLTLYAQWDKNTSIESTNTVNIKVYPNPANDVLNISNLKQGAQIVMYNAAGNIVLQQQAHSQQLTLNVSNLNKGIYFIKVDSNISKIIIE